MKCISGLELSISAKGVFSARMENLKLKLRFFTLHLQGNKAILTII